MIYMCKDITLLRHVQINVLNKYMLYNIKMAAPKR